MGKKETEKPTPLSTKVDQLLTEARIIIPGAQALLGFQFAVTLTRAFEQLPVFAKLARGCIVLRGNRCNSSDGASGVAPSLFRRRRRA